MKLFLIFTFLFIIVIFHETLSSAISYYDKFVKDQNSHRMFFRIPDYKRIQKTILCDMENDTDVSLKQSIIDGILDDQSIIITDCTKNINKGHKNTVTTKDANIVVITSDFNKIITKQRLEASIFLFKKSIVYIIITSSDRNFKCSHGKFKPEVFNQIQNWMNEFWHAFEIFRVVVVFPFTCPYKYIIYGGKKPSNRTLFDRTITAVTKSDFLKVTWHIIKSSDSLTQGYPLKASIFDRFPTSIYTCDKIKEYVDWNGKNTDGFCGLDGLVLNDFVNFFGFNITFPKYKECERYGYLKPDNTTGGSLGCVIKGKIDVSFNSRFLVQYTDEDYFYIYYVTSDSLCALLKQPDFKPLYLYPNAFHIASWVFIAALTLFLGTAAWVFAKISAKIKGESTKTFSHHMFLSCTSTFFGFSFDRLSKVRIIRGTCLLCSIVFIAVYQGYINYCFTTVSQFERIKTLSELYRSDVKLHTSSSIKALIKHFENPNDTDQLHFISSAKLFTRTNIGAVLQHPHAVTLVRKYDSYLEIMLKYTDSNQRPMLYIVDECFSLYYLSYIIRPGFPFAEELILFMQRMIEAGLPTMYYKWTALSFGVHGKLPKYGIEKRPYNQLTLSDQRVAFCLLFAGYLLAFIAFVLEKSLIFKKLWLKLRNKPLLT